MIVNVVTLKTLRLFWEHHPEAEVPLRNFLKVIRRARFSNLNELRLFFPHADLVKNKVGVTLIVFNIGGNNFRIVADVDLQFQVLYVKHVFTHTEYDSWNKKGRP